MFPTAGHSISVFPYGVYVECYEPINIFLLEQDIYVFLYMKNG